MINSVKFENFRGLKYLELPELSQITLLTGKNNAGKSSILEGIFLALDHSASESFGKINYFRGLPVNMEPSRIWEPIFYNLDTCHPMRISFGLDGESCALEYTRDDSFIPVGSMIALQNLFGQVVTSTQSFYSLKYTFRKGDYSEDGNFSLNMSGMSKDIRTSRSHNQILFLSPALYINAAIISASNDNTVAEWYGKMELNGKKQETINALRMIEPAISDIATIVQQGQAQLYVKVDSNLLPFKLTGDGLNKMLYIVSAIAGNPNAIILIDEIENGIHYSIQKEFWNTIVNAAQENNCQIIATTHSYECLQNAVDGIDEAGMEDAFCLYRIEHKNGANHAFRLTGDMVHYSVDANMEVR